jgi:replicative DNA helicase
MGVAKHAASCGHKVGVINLEMGDTQIGIRAIASKSNLPITMLRKGMLENTAWPKITMASGILADLSIYVCSTAFSTEQIEQATDKLIDDYECELIIYDYLQIIRPDKKLKNRNREQEVAEVSAMIKHKAMQLNFAAMPLAQLSRETDKRKDKRPQMSDLRESGAIENDADVVILIYPYECNCFWNLPCTCGKRDRIDFIIDKGRNCGPGIIESTWDRFTATFKGATEAAATEERRFKDG